MSDDFLKKYAQFLDPAPMACEDKKKKPVSGDKAADESSFSCDLSGSESCGCKE